MDDAQPGVCRSRMEERHALERRGLRPTWAEDSLQADVATVDESEQLEMAVGGPVLRIARRARSHDKIVEVSRSTFRGDRFTAWVQFSDDH